MSWHFSGVESAADTVGFRAAFKEKDATLDTECLFFCSFLKSILHPTVSLRGVATDRTAACVRDIMTGAFVCVYSSESSQSCEICFKITHTWKEELKVLLTPPPWFLTTQYHTFPEPQCKLPAVLQSLLSKTKASNAGQWFSNWCGFNSTLCTMPVSLLMLSLLVFFLFFLPSACVYLLTLRHSFTAILLCETSDLSGKRTFQGWKHARHSQRWFVRKTAQQRRVCSSSPAAVYSV